MSATEIHSCFKIQFLKVLFNDKKKSDYLTDFDKVYNLQRIK